jgi:hypothetical protein
MSNSKAFADQFWLGEKIKIDNEIVGYVTGVGVFIGDRIQIQIAYFNNGINQETWIDEFRIRKA